MIGHLEVETSARTFCAFLYVQGIANQVELERDGTWALWIHADDQIEAAKVLLNEYRAHPQDPKYLQAAEQALQKLKQEQATNEAAQKRYFDSGKVFPSAARGLGLLTGTLIAICVVTALISDFGSGGGAIDWLFISNYDVRGGVLARLSGLPEIRHGEIWRLFTPMFLHFGIPHLFFNMLWMFDLGTMVERRQGTGRLALLVLPIAALSNLGQYLLHGPEFGGMSGVVYGLIGYIWMRGKFDPASGLFLHQSTVTMAVIWFFLCLVGVIPHVANAAHGFGFGAGLAWGYLSALAAGRGGRR
jgi:rhomboid protease GlpG